jgi:hypothetical protein
MTTKITELALQAGLHAPYGTDHEGLRDFDYRRFAELILRDVNNILQDNWKALNNREFAEDGNPRSRAMYLGMRCAYITALDEITQHFKE